MKPLMMKFRMGGGAERDVYINMNQVCYIAPVLGGSVLTFAVYSGDEEMVNIRVNETPDEIVARSELAT